jgi:hypothetical protein
MAMKAIDLDEASIFKRYIWLLLVGWSDTNSFNSYNSSSRWEVVSLLCKKDHGSLIRNALHPKLAQYSMPQWGGRRISAIAMTTHRQNRFVWNVASVFRRRNLTTRNVTTAKMSLNLLSRPKYG